MPTLEIKTTCEADVRERWTIGVDDEIAAELLANPDEALEYLAAGYLSVENEDVDNERDREIVSVVVVDDPVEPSLWENDLIQFARLICEIRGTFSEVDEPGLLASMDLEEDDLDALYERAERVWQQAIRDNDVRHGRTPFNPQED